MPLAHIMEMAGELMAFALNIRIGYGSPHTLTPTGVKVMEGTCKGDAQVCQPTLLVLAPAILDKVFVGLQLKMKSAKPIVQKLFAMGLAVSAAPLRLLLTPDRAVCRRCARRTRGVPCWHLSCTRAG